MRNSIVKEKSYTFALEIIQIVQYLTNLKHEFVLSKQLLRSGTSIGANIEEALGGQSTKDFLSKISIAYKEGRETDYWLRLLKDSRFIDFKEYENINSKLQELLKILAKIQITLKKKITRNS